MTEDHEQQADAAERELADMEERSERVEEHIEQARKDWEAKKADSSVPGAAGDPDRAEEGGSHPETAYPAKGPDDEA
jgi:phage shock protein A